MEYHFLVKGIILGFSIAAPVGPIGILCIRRTLQYGRLSGFFSGLGAAVADTLYGAIAAFGLSVISNFLLETQTWLRILGGLFLVLLGLRTFFAKATETVTKVSHKTIFTDFISTFFLTMTNPMTILSYIAIFASLGLSGIGHMHLDAMTLIIGVFLGSAFWWLILSEGITLFKKKINLSIMQSINRVAGSIIILFGLIAWLTIV